MTRFFARYANSAGLNNVYRAINERVILRRNPQLEALVALQQPPRRISRRVSVYKPPVTTPKPIANRRNSAPAKSQMVGLSPPLITRAQLLQSLGMAQLLSLDDDEVSFFLFGVVFSR